MTNQCTLRVRAQGLVVPRFLACEHGVRKGKKSDVPETHLLNPGDEPPPDPTWPHSPPAG